MRKFFETGEIHDSFKVEKERFSQCNWNPVFPLAVHMGNFNNVLDHAKNNAENNSNRTNIEYNRNLSNVPEESC